MHAMLPAGGLILGLACDHFVVNAQNTSMRLGLTELQVGVPFPLFPLAVVKHQAPVPAAKRLVFSADLIDAPTAVAAGVAVAAAPGQAPEQSALAWLQTATSRPLQGFAATKQVPPPLPSPLCCSPVCCPCVPVE